jgi:hypothetical protein
VSERFFLPQAKYYQTITGFANMTHVFNVRASPLSSFPLFVRASCVSCDGELIRLS